MSSISVASALTLPCGQTLPNRICKSAMSEGLADDLNRATEEHCRLYREWSRGGTGLLITGNVQVDRRYMESPGNVAVDGVQSEEALTRLRALADAAQTAPGCKCWVQLGHAGRQCDPLVNTSPVGPSDVSLEGVLATGRGETRAMSAEEVRDVVTRMADAAKVCQDSGFSGVQIHAAHGYLLSSFLNPRANRRTDEYGGSLENRARLLLDSVRAVRAVVRPDFAVSVKINSSDFQKGGFTVAECAQVAAWLDEEKIDLLEISGGNYEQPAMMGDLNTNRSTVVREAYFLEFAKEIRAATKRTPIMVTGSIRSRTTMEEALDSGDCDVIGIGRPLCGMPDASAKLLSGEISEMPRFEKTLDFPMLMYPIKFFTLGPKLRFFGQTMWCGAQLRFMGQGRGVQTSFGLVAAIRTWFRENKRMASELKDMECVGTSTNATRKCR